MRLMLAAIAALSLTPALAMAEDSPEEVALEARKGFMQMTGTNMDMLAGMAKGDIAYDEATASVSAANLETLSRYTVGMHFIPRTAAGEMDDSEALPKIWEDMPGFQAKYVAFGEAVAGASEGVKGGQDKLAAVVEKIGGSCKGCHDDYRKK